jgi:peptidylprolyl isomerase
VQQHSSALTLHLLGLHGTEESMNSAAMKKRRERQLAAREEERALLEAAATKEANTTAEAEQFEEESSKPRPNPMVYMDFAIGDIGGDERINHGKPERVVFELFSDRLPITSENFRCLCTGERGNGSRAKLCYRGSPVHRVVQGFAFEGGDIESGDGNGGESIYGAPFVDEAYTVKHDAAGILTSAKVDAGKNSNASQWMVTLAAAQQLDGKHVAFGVVRLGIEDRVPR